MSEEVTLEFAVMDCQKEWQSEYEKGRKGYKKKREWEKWKLICINIYTITVYIHKYMYIYINYLSISHFSTSSNSLLTSLYCVM